METIIRKCIDGRTFQDFYGRDYLIEDQEIERFQRERRKVGRPRKKKTLTVSPEYPVHRSE